MSIITIKTVKTIEEWLQCQHIRAAAFLQTEPYEEEFDNKDFEMATHILAKVGALPAACMRLSLYSPKNGGIIHWGRLAMMPNTDSKKRLSILNSIADYAADYSDNCGFEICIGEVADERLLKFWKRRGFYATDEAAIRYGNRMYKKLVRKNKIGLFARMSSLNNDSFERSIRLQ